jgi:hypothetical protein
VIGRIEDIPASWRTTLDNIRFHLRDAVLAGGALRDRDNGRPVKDLDVFVGGETERDLFAIRQKLVDAGFACEEIDTERMYPIGEHEVVGFFGVRDPSVHLTGVPDAIQLIVVRWPTDQIVRRFDFGICQIAFDGTEVIRTAAYHTDKAERTFRICRQREDFELEASVKRYARLLAKYEGWDFSLGEALGKDFLLG